MIIQRITYKIGTDFVYIKLYQYNLLDVHSST